MSKMWKCRGLIHYTLLKIDNVRGILKLFLKPINMVNRQQGVMN